MAADPGDSRNLLSDPQQRQVTRRSPTRVAWLVAGVWLLVALVAVYWGHVCVALPVRVRYCRQRHRYGRIAALDRDVALARYLEMQGPPFLAILDEVSQVTQGIMLDEIRYDREGRITIAGTLGSADALNRFASELATMKTIEAVQVRNQSAVDRDKVKYTLIARPSKRYFGGFVVPPPASPESERPNSSSERNNRRGDE